MQHESTAVDSAPFSRPARPSATSSGEAGSVAWITVAPVKALALSSVGSANVTRTGVDGDRRFALVDAGARLVNGKRVGRLVRLVPSFDAAARMLAIRFPDGTVVDGCADPAGEPIEAIFFGRPRSARLVAGPWSEAISSWAGIDLRLIELEPGNGTDRGDPAGSVTLLSAAALGTLAAEGGREDALDGRRFRMTFGIDGVSAHAEDAWIGRRVRVGSSVVEVRGNVGRCAITTQDPDTGEPDFDTLGALARSRGSVATTEPLPMGVWATIVEPGRVDIGDAVEPLPDASTAGTGG